MLGRMGQLQGRSCQWASASCLHWAWLKPTRVCSGTRPEWAKQSRLGAISNGVSADHPALHMGRASLMELGKQMPPKARSPLTRRAEPVGEGRLRWGRGPGRRHLQGPAGTSTTSPRQSRVLAEGGLAQEGPWALSFPFPIQAQEQERSQELELRRNHASFFPFYLFQLSVVWPFCCSLITTLSDLCFLIKEQTCSLGHLLILK